MTNERIVLDGRFRLLRHLGGGGMSEVYLAEQLSLGRKVALKVLKRDMSAQPAMAERFKREAQLLSTVDHPSVVRVIDFASGAEGTVLVLELAEGQTLEDALEPGPFEPKRAVAALLQLAEGLAAIHDKGIVHRDIKPQNVVIGTSAKGEQARLLDFGIARLMEIPDEGRTKTAPELPAGTNPMVSVPGQALGTPAYVAPEQAMALPVDARTDVYSFGVLAYRVLCGRLPFTGPDAREFLLQHIREKPPSLDVVSPHLLAWPTLIQLVMQCLEKKPDARPKDGHALVTALQAVIPADANLTSQTRKALGALTTQTWSTVQVRAGSLKQQGVERAKRAVVPLAAKFDAPLRRALLIVVGVVAALSLVWKLWPASRVERLEALLERGESQAALTAIDAALPEAKGEVPALVGLKLAALVRLGRTEEARRVLREQPYQALYAARRATFAAVAELLGSEAHDDELERAVALAPQAPLEAAFGRFAQEPASARQWGALRWLDARQRAQGLSLAREYEKALTSVRCDVRSVAARRLSDVGDERAIAPLRELSELPKDDSPRGPVNCGQDEAAETIRQLKKKK